MFSYSGMMILVAAWDFFASPAILISYFPPTMDSRSALLFVSFMSIFLGIGCMSSAWISMSLAIRMRRETLRRHRQQSQYTQNSNKTDTTVTL